MSRFFYFRLAWSNIKKNAQTYVPYMLTCMGSIMMYYIIRGLSLNESMQAMSGGMQMQSIMEFGSVIIAIFAVIFLFYTNSFLIRRRKKEFGLYNILGMEKRHLGRMVFWESVDTFLISIASGLAAGMLFSKLVYLAADRLIRLELPIKFEVSVKAMAEAFLLFGIIFLINLGNTLRQIRLANPVELLKGGNVGEKEPKTKWLMSLIGFVCLGGGYYLAVTVANPVEAMVWFFVAVILVIIATYFLFTAGSIVVLKLMRRSKKFYYRKNHFITVSGMMYRMKQNAAGLASICVLSTGVLILLSTTVCTYLGTEDTLRLRYPRNMYFDIWNISENTREEVAKIKDRVLEENGAEEKDELAYDRYYCMSIQDGNHFSPNTGGMNTTDFASVACISLDDYNRLMDRDVTLEENEVLLYIEAGKLEEPEVYFGEEKFLIKERLEEFPIPTEEMGGLLTSYYLVLPERAAADRIAAGLEAAGEDEKQVEAIWDYYCGFDLEMEADEQLAIYEQMQQEIQASGIHGTVRSVAEARSSFYGLNGGLLFIGIFLGGLFLMATVLIIYYKQISEGYDDRERYQIMQKVGMSKREVKRSIRSQVLTVFYLPLIMAGIHIVFAFRMIRSILYMLGLVNTQFFVMCTAVTMILFAGLYCLVYVMTARRYYKIVTG